MHSGDLCELSFISSLTHSCLSNSFKSLERFGLCSTSLYPLRIAQALHTAGILERFVELISFHKVFSSNSNGKNNSRYSVGFENVFLFQAQWLFVLLFSFCAHVLK